MTLKEYVNSFPRNQRGNIRRWIATQLQVSEVYVRSMCNGLKPIHAKYAIKIEKITSSVVPRYVTAPDFYPLIEYQQNTKKQ